MPISDELADSFDRLYFRREAATAAAKQGRPEHDPLLRAAVQALHDAEAAFVALLDKEERQA